MRRRALSSLVALGLLGTVLAGCGLGTLGSANARSAGLFGARGADDTAPVVPWEFFEDFDANTLYGYDWVGPSGHPFIDALRIAPVRVPKITGRVSELLALPSHKPRRGLRITQNIEDVGNLYDEDEKKARWVTVPRVSFEWANNGGQTNEVAVYAHVIYALKVRGAKTLHGLGYAWTNAYKPGTVLSSSMQLADGELQMRTIALDLGVGAGVACGQDAYNQMSLLRRVRNLRHDHAWAYDRSTPTIELGAPGNVKLSDVGAVPTPSPEVQPAPPPQQFVLDGSGKEIPNQEIEAIAMFGFGGDIPKAGDTQNGICSHAIVDNFAIQRPWGDYKPLAK